MYFDRWDICEAWYIYLSENYEGQGDDKYRRLCRLLEYFRPRVNLRRETLSENAIEILANLEAE